MLVVSGLNIRFSRYERGLRRRYLQVITDLDLEVKAGEVVAVVGASGSGKSLLAHALLGLLPENATLRGTLLFQGQPLTPERCRQLRGKAIALIPQSVDYLDPLMQVGSQVQRVARLSGASQGEARRAVSRIFARYRLPPGTEGLYPFQLSGGMARRVLVSTAAVSRAKLVIADEPTPGLDAEVVAETLAHLRELAQEGRGVMLITHDIQAALSVADRVAVLYAGTTVELASAQDFERGNLRHPYTQALWRSLPQNEFAPLPGNQPDPEALPAGCLFGDRCPWASEICRAERPPLRAVGGGWVRCIHAQG
jgi:peptide/nickel transport system ATP-binding protein